MLANYSDIEHHHRSHLSILDITDYSSKIIAVTLVNIEWNICKKYHPLFKSNQKYINRITVKELLTPTYQMNG